MAEFFSKSDLDQIHSLGMSEEQISSQINSFKNGFPSAALYAPATIGNGMLQPGTNNIQGWIELYEKESKQLKIQRFVPASGAATRMFKALFSALDKLEGKSEQEQEVWLENEPEIKDFCTNIAAYPFAGALGLAGHETAALLLEKVLGPAGLNYGALPKGMLLFHTYPDGSRTPLEEHLREAAPYCTDKDGTMHFHLTVSPDHLEGFRELALSLVPIIERACGSRADITFSTQKTSTDTLAVNPDNTPFRDEDGKLVFRPGGHGALLENLNDLDADLVFISNIDNVSPDRNKSLRIRYKKILGGILLEARAKVFAFLDLISKQPAEELPLDEIRSFLKERFCIEPALDYSGDALKEELFSLLNRPIRVCGMVKNQGEPGGGPFIVKGGDGQLSLQIVESSQINLEDPEQEAVFNKASHFNPVDLVCALSDFRGQPFDLLKYRDPDTGFIASKSVSGREIKALELPGLWNGSMAHWLTIFAEVPVESFTPVKTVFDLLRPEHQ